MTSEQSKIYRGIILDKCFEKASIGSDNLNKDDILDIVTRCEAKGIVITKQDLAKYKLDT